MATYAPRPAPTPPPTSAPAPRPKPGRASAPRNRSIRSGRSLSRVATAAIPVSIVAALAIAYLVFQPQSLDLAAAEYRADLFGRTGFSIWDLQWYGGHYLPGYSVCVPALAWLLGARVLGVVAVLASTVLFERLVRPRDALSALAVTAFGLGCFASLLSGRITFTAAIPIAVAALLVDRRGPRNLGGAAATLVLSALTALFSPVASPFLAVAWTALLLTRRRAFYLAALASTFAPLLALNLAFPVTGVEPMSPSQALPVLACAAALLLIADRRHRTLRLAVVICLAGCVVTALLDTPLGSNVLRLGPLCAASVAALTVAPRRRVLLLALAVPLLYWQWAPAVRDIAAASGDPTTSASYYRPLLGYLDRASGPAGEAAGGGFRVEIPFTRLHWESRWVAPRYALARGWERNGDTGANPLFYGARLTAAEYEHWLHENAVRYVALPDTGLDYSAQGERRIIESHPRFLRPVFASRDWQVYAVVDPTPLVGAPGRLVSLSSEAVAIAMPAGASEVIRVHWNPYWSIESGSGCVSPAGRWTRLSATDGGVVRIGERFSIGRIGSESPRCTSADP